MVRAKKSTFSNSDGPEKRERNGLRGGDGVQFIVPSGSGRGPSAAGASGAARGA